MASKPSGSSSTILLEEYSHSSAPEVFLAALSQRTENIRLGHGIMHALPAINHPARIAERISTLDLLSAGRIEFGTGEGSAIAELAAFGVNPEEKNAMWDEGVRVAVRCMTEEPFTGHSGRYVTLPPRNVVPKPLQKPHPPLWLACSRRESIHRAAQNGMGALSFAFFDPEAVRLAASNPDRLGAKVTAEGVTGLRGAMGTPSQVRDYLRRYEDCGVDQIILSCASGRNKHEHIMESLELFGRVVMPEFLEREEERQRKKDERLAPILETIMARKPKSDHPPLSNPDYAITALPRAQADAGESEKFHKWLDAYADRIAEGEDVSKRLR